MAAYLVISMMTNTDSADTPVLAQYSEAQTIFRRYGVLLTSMAEVYNQKKIGSPSLLEGD
jgi:hypothetical protein